VIEEFGLQKKTLSMSAEGCIEDRRRKGPKKSTRTEHCDPLSMERGRGVQLLADKISATWSAYGS